MTSAVVVAGGGPMLRAAIEAVYAELAIAVDPATAGALDELVPGVTAEQVARALRDAYAVDRRLEPRAPDAALLDAARALRAAAPRALTALGYDRAVTDRLHFTDSDEANELIARDPLALLIGFALDQQVTVQKAFEGPLVLRGGSAASTPRDRGRRPRADLPRASGDPPLPRLDGEARARPRRRTSPSATTATPHGSGPTPARRPS